MPARSTPPPRRHYAQFCPVASALDVVGERWTLLIARDLLLGPKRYTDLREGLPGIATDLLTARLRTLEAAGLVQRRTLPRPAPATVYELTERGAQLGRIVQALGQLGLGFVGAAAPDEDMPAERFVVALRASFRPDALPGLDETYELRLGAETFAVAVRDGTVETARGSAPGGALVLRADPVTLVRLLRAELTAEQATASGALEVEGRRGALVRFVAAFAWR